MKVVIFGTAGAIKWAFYEVMYKFWLLMLNTAEYVYRNAEWNPVKDIAFRITAISFIHLSDAFMALVKLGKRELTEDVVRAYEDLEAALDEIMAE